MDLNRLDSKQLKRFIVNASSALNRRQKLESAVLEIQRIAKKHKLTKDDFKIVLDSVQAARSFSSAKPKSTRAKVEPKYQSQDGTHTWTGRGRSPAWVLEICQRKALSVEDFKSDRRFLIQNKGRRSSSV